MDIDAKIFNTVTEKASQQYLKMKSSNDEIAFNTGMQD